MANIDVELLYSSLAQSVPSTPLIHPLGPSCLWFGTRKKQTQPKQVENRLVWCWENILHTDVALLQKSTN